MAAYVPLAGRRWERIKVELAKKPGVVWDLCSRCGFGYQQFHQAIAWGRDNDPDDLLVCDRSTNIYSLVPYTDDGRLESNKWALARWKIALTSAHRLETFALKCQQRWPRHKTVRALVRHTRNIREEIEDLLGV